MKKDIVMLNISTGKFVICIMDLDRRKPHFDVLKPLCDLGEVINLGAEDEEVFYENLHRIHLLIIRLMRIDKLLLEKCTNLRAIIKAGVGTDHIDDKTATRLGIHVIISTGNDISVAESAMLFILALSRNLMKLFKA